MTASAALPLRVVHHQATGVVELFWSDGVHASLASHVLRGACRCASCESLRRGGTGPRAAHGVYLTEMLPVGEFGVQLCFDDGHNRGIYPWAYLHELSTMNCVASIA